MRTSEIENLVLRLRQYFHDARVTEELDGIILHGSRVRDECDLHSDYDLVLICPYGGGRYDLQTIGEYDCDMFFVDDGTARSLCSKDTPTNNNFLLRAISTGIVLYDTSGKLAQLQEHAQRRWEAGPQAASFDELLRMRISAIKIGTFLEKCLRRSSEGSDWLRIAEANSGIFIARLVDTFCRIERLWSHAFWIILRQDDKRYGLVQIAITNFLLAGDDLSRSVAIQHFAGIVETLANARLAEMPIRKSGSVALECR